MAGFCSSAIAPRQLLLRCPTTVHPVHMHCPNDESVQTNLQRIVTKASKDKRCQFTSLFHLMNKELLLECFTQLKGNAAVARFDSVQANSRQPKPLADSLSQW